MMGWGLSIIGEVIQNYTFTIYNRWRELVFKTSNLKEGWGTVNGMQQNSGICMALFLGNVEW